MQHKAYHRGVLVVCGNGYSYGNMHVFSFDEMRGVRNLQFIQTMSKETPRGMVIKAFMGTLHGGFNKITKVDMPSGGGRAGGVRVARQMGKENTRNFAECKISLC